LFCLAVNQCGVQKHFDLKSLQIEYSLKSSAVVPSLTAAGSAILAARAQKSSFLESSQQHWVMPGAPVTALLKVTVKNVMSCC